MKILKRIMLCLCLFFSSTILWACGKEDAKITGIYFKEGSVDTEVEQFSEYSTSNIKVIAKYDDGTEKEISGVSFQNISTNSTGEQTLKANYEGFSCEISINVTPFAGERPYYITAIKSPSFVSVFEEKSNTENEYTNQIAADAASKTKGFVKTGDSYKVGNDNPFKFSPSISVEWFDYNKDPEDIHSYPISADVYKHNGTSYELISADDLADYATIDANLHTFKFGDDVTGKFKIEVRPDFDVIIDEDEDLSDGEQALNGNQFISIPFEFEVVDGWNVYNAKELSIVDNSNDEGKWTDIKQAAGLVNKTTNAVILHNDIDITTNDIPSVHIFSDTNTDGYQGADLEKVKGYFINEDGYDTLSLVYKRVIPNGGEFTIEGNYYTISAENLPLVNNPEWEASDVAVVCTALFGFIDNEAVTQDIGAIDTTEEDCYINNVSFMGNSKKAETTGPAGMCCYKTENVNFTMDNCLSQAWYIAHFFEGSSLGGGLKDLTDSSVQPTHKLINCTTFDSYNTIMYCQGARNVIIEDSFLIGAGGPVMICDEETDEYDKTGGGKDIYNYPTNVKVKNSKLQSYIVGTESWFIWANAGSIVANMQAMNLLLNTHNNSIVSKNTDGVDAINLIAVFKDSDAAGIAECNINSSFNDITENGNLGLALSTEEDAIDITRNEFITQISQQITAANSGKKPEEIKELIEETLGKMAILQDFKNGSFKVPGDKGYLLDPTSGASFTPGYLNIHLFNGMAAILGVQ